MDALYKLYIHDGIIGHCVLRSYTYTRHYDSLRVQYVADPGGGGATGARPPKIGSTVIFYKPFCIRMLKNRALIALESIKPP